MNRDALLKIFWCKQVTVVIYLCQSILISTLCNAYVQCYSNTSGSLSSREKDVQMEESREETINSGVIMLY